jgi:hypothetical protein
MIRLIALAGLLFATYRLGEQKGKLSDMDFFITNNSYSVTTYAQIDNDGTIGFTTDMNLGTPLNFWDANKLKSIIKKFSPDSILKLQTVSNIITAQQSL